MGQNTETPIKSLGRRGSGPVRYSEQVNKARAKDMTMREVAQHCGVSSTQLYRHLSGQVHSKRLAQKLDQLLNESTEQP